MTWDIAKPTRQVTECTPTDTRGPKRLWDAPAGLVRRDRGDVGRIVRHDYLCPVHGRFEVEVASNDVPDYMACPFDVGPPEHAIDFVEDDRVVPSCGELALWSPSTFGIWQSAGEVSS